MASRDSTYDRARRQAHDRVARATTEIRLSRVGLGMSQQTLATRVGISRTRVSRIESGLEPRVPAELLVRMAGAVGLDLVVRAYPGGDPAIDAPQRRTFGRFCDRLGDGWARRMEVPLGIAGDLRAWDAVITHRATRVVVHVEVETRLVDVQALLRRLARKRRDGSAQRLVLLIADTRHNREVLAHAEADFTSVFPASVRRAWRMLRAGLAPSADVLFLV